MDEHHNEAQQTDAAKNGDDPVSADGPAESELSGQPHASAPDAELSTDELWDHIGDLLANHPGHFNKARVTDVSPEELAKRRKKTRRIFRSLDIVASVLWVALIAKVLVADFDRMIVGAVAPQMLWLLDLRFFGLLALVALFFLFVKSWKVGGTLLYIAFFPVIVLVWKIPKTIILNFQRPAIAFGIMNVITAFVLGFKAAVIALAVACIAALVIVFVDGVVALATAMIVLLTVLLVWLFLSTRSALKPPRFVTAQQKTIFWIADRKVLELFRAPTAELEPSRVRQWNAENANQFVANAGNGLIMYRAVSYWAYSLDRYRTSPAQILFGSLAVLLLLIEVALTFAFLNFGMWRIDPTQYQTVGEPAFWTFIYYSFSALAFGEIEAAQPIGEWAIIIKTINGVLGSLVIVTVIATAIQTYRHTRTDEASLAAVKALRARADELGAEVGRNFADSLEDLDRRLNAMGWGMRGIANWLAARIPSEWDPEGRGPRSGP